MPSIESYLRHFRENSRHERKKNTPLCVDCAHTSAPRGRRINRIPQLKSEREANLEQLVLASTRNFTSQIADSIFWNLRFAIWDPEGLVFAAEGFSLLMTSRSTEESGFNVQCSRVRKACCEVSTFASRLTRALPPHHAVC
jgi:hypothetical protein